MITHQLDAIDKEMIVLANGEILNIRFDLTD